MDTLIYLLLGLIDIVCVFALFFKLYRWPFWKYAKEIFIVSGLLSVISWVDRIILGIADYDAAIQYFLIIISLRYIFTVKWNNAFTLATIGYLSFVCTQNIVYYILLSTGLVGIFDAQLPQGYGTYLIQLTNHIVDILICLLLFVGGYGFSYLTEPPHEMRYRVRGSKTNKIMGIINIVAALVFTSTMYWITSHHNHIYIIVTSTAIALIILVVISQKRDVEQ
jgi:hypothetical protein